MKHNTENLYFILILIAFLALVTWLASFIPEYEQLEQRTSTKAHPTVTKEAGRQVTERVTPYINPVHIEDFVRLTSPYGIRKLLNPFTGGTTERIHRGVDFVGTWRARIVAIADGIVIERWYVPDNKYRTGHELFGGYLRVLHEDGNVSGYGHLSAVYVVINEVVKQGQVLGRMGNTGISTGQHLHLSVQNKNGEFVNPLMYIGIE